MKVRPKPKDAVWTDEQWQAIDAKGNNILVAAAAGSGKTAVLVERIIRKIVDPDDEAEVDRLLIVTFTNAAAAEMRNRIGEAINKEIQKQPGSLHLRRQLSLLNRAHISTLHSFCMNVIRKYYYKVNIDPKFRILDDTEGELMREEIIEDIFEEEYGIEGNSSFYNLVDMYSGDRSDDALRSLVRRLYDFSRSHPSPEYWLDQMAARYDISDAERVEDLPWTPELLQDIQSQLRGAQSWIEKALQVTHEPGGPHPYGENLSEDLEKISLLLQADNWAELYDKFQTFTYGKLKTIRKTEGVLDDLKEQAKSLRERAKKQTQELKEGLFSRPPEVFLKDVKTMAPSIRYLVKLVKEFSSRYQEAKREKALVDFSDLEHICLTILTQGFGENGTRLPSEAAKEYQDYFVEVMVDEYQDTNLVQETILSLLSKGDNRFMVGDVKQSIYRFRLAEPGLFLQKYKKYQEEDNTDGWRIDLAKNFRSRSEVLDATNFLFRQVMDERVGEISYDQAAELRLGNTSYPQSAGFEAELAVINKGDPIESSRNENELIELEEELETAQLEARLIARKIKGLVESGQEVFDKDSKAMRKIRYRDVVILMRSMPWAATMMEEFKKENIPVYAELSTGYFEAVEVAVMMSLLKVIDNPYQDIPLASVLRSPIIGLDEEELAQIRIKDRKSSYYEALKIASIEMEDEALKDRVTFFLERLNHWRTSARCGSLSELIWDLYRETGYYDFVGGLTGGKQRQANLRALYDRARAYEETSFRGLFRFLRFIERMQERGDDLGAARALGEQEDVVRIMTVHKSKGLEFPVVFFAGMNKQFNMQDVRGTVMLHKELGLGSKFIDSALRVSYPTLPQLAIKSRMKLESIAEEMRVLYVALTRAKEKLYLVGTVKDAEKSLQKWQEHVSIEDWLLPAAERAKSSSYLDWIGPAVLRHSAGTDLRGEENAKVLESVENDPSRWKIEIKQQEELQQLPEKKETAASLLENKVKRLDPVEESSPYQEVVRFRLEWDYPFQSASVHRSKQTVSEIKHDIDDEYSDREFIGHFKSEAAERPRFMQRSRLTPAERGTAIHAVMQHVPLRSTFSKEEVDRLLFMMTERELLTKEQAESVDTEAVVQFLSSELGKRVSSARTVEREVPFTVAMASSKAYRDWNENEEDEKVLVQGVVDLLFRDEKGDLVLVDYKSDKITNRFTGGFEEAEQVMRERYQTQVSIYRQALESIFNEKIQESYLYFFDGSYTFAMHTDRKEE
ncbi:helicase-exonuclease AddAB subunit AddA [Bacillus sp. FJAT-44742]|uniref:helicase-exonuclease AddAB subunit AddA n=1 Tax=Bacillus sp. FJAT-44742 TaxID=2014005 RepID=UPI000C24120C|nr:helicase-exonuclease AddAB subunit AddA [Bacillus sp. FJAT-44742]